MRGRAAVHPHDVRRLLAVRGHRLRVRRRVHQRVHVAAVVPLQPDLARHRQVPGLRDLLGLPAQHLGLAGGRVDPDHRQRRLRAAGHRHDRVAIRGHAGHELLEWHLEVGQLAGLRVEHAQPHPALAVQHGQPPVAQRRVGPAPQLPQRVGELLLGRVQRLGRLADQANLVQVPPARPVRDHVQAGLVAPHRRQHGLPHPALNQPPASQHAVRNLGHPQFGPIPGHPGMIPADPGQPAPIG